jgi:hypothetical protein
MPKTTYPDCFCCAPCCGVGVGIPTLTATIQECPGTDPSPITLNLTAITPTAVYEGDYTCDGGDCEMEFILACEDNGDGTYRLVFTVQRDAGPPACNRCTLSSDQVGASGTLTCSPFEFIVTGLFFTDPGCDKCDCDPLVGPITVIITA